MEDKEVCKVCFTYFVRPRRQTNKCCSKECSTINRKFNERNRKRCRQGFQGASRNSDSWARQRAVKACDGLLELLQTHHSAPVSLDTQTGTEASETGTSGPQLSVRRTEAEPETGAVSRFAFAEVVL